MKFSISVMALCICMFSLTAAPIYAQEEAIIVPTGERQLFLDDYIVAEINNLTHTMHQPAKKGAVIRPNRDMGENVIQVRSAPAWDREQKIWKLWDVAAGPVDLGFGVTGYYESQDGLHWTQPSVGQIEYRGSTENNYISVMIEGKHYRTDSVVYDPTDPDPARRYKCFLPTMMGPVRDTGGGAISPDGVTWTPLDIPAIPSADEWNLSFDEKEHLFIGMVKVSGPYRRSWAITTSTDFEHWTEPALIFHADELDQEIASKDIERCFADPRRKHPEYNTPGDAASKGGAGRPPGGGGPPYVADIYQFPVFRYEGLYIGLPTIFHQTGTAPPDWDGFDKMHLSDYILGLVRKYGDYTGFHDVELACSRDLHTWQRLGDRQPFIPLSPLGGGAYDIQTIMPPSSAVVRGDELWFYYTGLKGYAFISSGKEPGFDDYFPGAGAICLAVLRRDGFISLDAAEETGSIVTKPLRVPEGSERLFVNVDAPGGELRAVILNTSGQPVEGFAIDKCVPVTGDQPRAEVTWEGNADLSALAGQDIQIRFRLHNASFYSFWFE